MFILCVKGQIDQNAVLEVLLDTLLCTLGPLLCLTQLIPELKDESMQEKMSKMMDDIAYIMPGL